MKDPYAHLTARQAAVRRYFTPTPAFPRVIVSGAATVLGLILLLSAAASPFYAIAGLIVAILGGRKCIPRIYRHLQYKKLAEPKPTDEQMDLWLQEAFDPARAEGFKRLDIANTEVISPGTQPMLVVGYPQDVSPRLARGRDGLVRCDKYDILVVYLTNWHLCTYRCMLDMETGLFVSDETHEFHYRDVLSVATSSDRIVLTLPVDHSRPAAAVVDGESASAPQATVAPVLESTSRMMFRLRVASDEIAIQVRLFDSAVNGEDHAVDLALKQIRGRLREYTKLHDEKGLGQPGAFDDLHQARQRADSPWPGASPGWRGAGD